MWIKRVDCGGPKIGPSSARSAILVDDTCRPKEFAMPVQPPLANIITLGARDLARQRDFYQRLGWPIVLDSDDFIVFELGGALVALFPLDKLARDAKTQPAPDNSGIRTAVTISVDRPTQVDELATQARAAGGRLTKEPTDAEFFEGRDAYFADPEGNYWEIAWAPASNPVLAAARRAAGTRA
jgi:uncharacterized protein